MFAFLQKRFGRYALSVLSGILFVLCFPYSGSLTPLVFVAFVPLLLVEDQLAKSKKRGFFLHAYVTFFIYNLGTTWWIWYSTDVGAILAFVFNSLLMALGFWAYHFAKTSIGRKQGYFSLPLIWLGFEYAHFNWELSWPWLSFGNVFSIFPDWVQWYEFTGVLGGTLWVVIVNLMLFLYMKRKWLNGGKNATSTLIFGVLFLAIPIVASYVIKSSYSFSKNKNYIEAVIVQPNIDPYTEKFSSNLTVEEQMERFYTLAQQKITSSTRLIIGPETAISQGFFESDISIYPFYTQLLDTMSRYPNAELLIGASTAKMFDKKVSVATQAFSNGEGFYESYNTSLFLYKMRNHGFIHKSKLVLGVEKIPFAAQFPFLENLAIENGGTTGTLGIEDSPKVFRAAFGNIAPIVCYESIYGDFVAQQARQNAQLLCIITNDGWWKDSPGYKQHFSFARLRAIETRKYVVRSANTGKSGVINELGEVEKETGWWKKDVIRARVRLNSTPTVYVTYGDYLGRSSLFVSLLILLFAFKQWLVSKLKKTV
ncbi:MAG: apolipoprotein N-acyltransferase [Bacteroidota bacterium]|jgi:apolipoprotein N-acyltransferase